MPTHAPDASFSPRDTEIAQNNVACPAPLTPPIETGNIEDPRSTAAQQTTHGNPGIVRRLVSDNTAAGMALMQEETMYTASAIFDDKVHTDITDQPSAPMESAVNHTAYGGDRDQVQERRTEQLDDITSMVDVPDGKGGINTNSKDAGVGQKLSEEAEVESGLLSPPLTSSPDDESGSFGGSPSRAGIPSIDQELDWANNDLKDWDFSHHRLRPQYPSTTFQPYSKFKGTQQSDRQIYNVEVTILTVDIEQSTMSGYLQICGLTLDHPTLTTFFTGEIIGGPDQKYSFRTRDPAWGASDKTDLTHWARFPAWRPLSLHAKRNINFVYPMNHENWWQQEYIFMRWKEHFLVPDYKLKSIQGASFEGFYYICFNQIEGRVSGIYFHSKSEKYVSDNLKATTWDC